MKHISYNGLQTTHNEKLVH